MNLLDLDVDLDVEEEIHVTVTEWNHYWCVCGFISPQMDGRYADMYAGMHESGPYATSFLNSTRRIE